MGVRDILSRDRVSIAGVEEGRVQTPRDALQRLSGLLTMGQDKFSALEIERVLTERERLQSTGVGGGVAMPHGYVKGIDRLIGAMLICPSAIDFDAIDGAPVSILLATLAPMQTTGRLARPFRRMLHLLDDSHLRARLLCAPNGAAAFDILASKEQ